MSDRIDNASIDEIPEYILDAVAFNRLVVVTGAGISTNLERVDGVKLPDWAELVTELRRRGDLSRLLANERCLLDLMLPQVDLRILHGDVLIEASEIIEKSYDADVFQSTIAALCGERERQTTDVHRAICELLPAGIVTFNYDRGHESALLEFGRPFQQILYNNDEGLRSILSDQGDSVFIVKAHGSIEDPKTLVLTSKSYREILSGRRVYRAFLQHALVRYTMLIVGFAMRDRDFDQLLATIEMEFGSPVQPHAFIARKPGVDHSGLARRAEWAALTARFGINPIYVDEYQDIPNLIRRIASTPGPKVKKLLEDAVSSNKILRAAAHDRLDLLGPVGRAQARLEIFRQLGETALQDDIRGELIYSLRSIGDGDPITTSIICRELHAALNGFSESPSVGSIERAAHCLLVLRRSRINSAAIVGELTKTSVVNQLTRMDEWLVAIGEPVRLIYYLQAAVAEINARLKSA